MPYFLLVLLLALTFPSTLYGQATAPAAAPAVIPPPVLLPAPPQDQGLPYTRSARSFALKKIQNEIAVFAGSRYAYVKGFKVRLDQARLRQGEAELKDGKILVPASFAGVLDLKEVHPAPAPAYLVDKWVYDLNLPSKTGDEVDLAALARSRGLKVYQDGRGLLLIGDQDISFTSSESTLEDSVVTLFDTPEKFADPDIATKYIPILARQGKMTDHVKVTPEQWAILSGPETVWPTAPKSEYDFTGFNRQLLGSKVPPPGVYPRLLFSAEDLPYLSRRLKNSKVGQMSLIEIDHLFKKSWWDPSTSDGQIFQKLSQGDTTGLEWDVSPGTPPGGYPQTFKGEKPGIYNSHVAYIPECLTTMALYCLLTNDDAHGRQAATALVTYYKMREPLLDELNQISDSEFGSSLIQDGLTVPMDGNGSTTHWRSVAGVIAHMNLGFALDFGGKWMTAEQKDTLRRIIAKATYGRRSYGQDAPVRFRDVNWVGWDLTDFLAVASIEGLEGFDPEAYESGVETVRSFCDWGIDDSGVVYESDGKTPGSFQFITLSMITAARRGDNYWGHPHWRKLLTGQIEMTSPTGQVVVNSGTQYAPYSREKFSLQFTDELKAFYPEDQRPDYLLHRADLFGGAKDEGWREWMIDDFDPAAFKEKVSKLERLRMPSVTYPGFVHGLLYDTDFVATSRAELGLPLDFNAPVHGVFSSYSDRSKNAAWMNMLVRPDHYLGAGHHHADAGMFHFSALGVDWFTLTAFSQTYSGKYYNLVQVDGHSEMETIPGMTLGWNAAAKYLGATLGHAASLGVADLTYAYTYTWLTQPQQKWSDESQARNWELEPSPNILKIFAGTYRYKIREWWSSYTYSNYIATSRSLFNPMQYVYRTAGLVRGEHPYGFLLDDLKKDEQSHLYQWVGMLNGGVWKADAGTLPPNELVLASQPNDFSGKVDPTPAPPITPQADQPLLLVCALNLTDSGQANLPLIQVETLRGPDDKQNHAQYYHRLTISSQATQANFKVLLLPYRMGETVPQATYDTATQTATIHWGKQTDTFTFTPDATHRTQVKLHRDGNLLLESK